MIFEAKAEKAIRSHKIRIPHLFVLHDSTAESFQINITELFRSCFLGPYFRCEEDNGDEQ